MYKILSETSVLAMAKLYFPSPIPYKRLNYIYIPPYPFPAPRLRVLQVTLITFLKIAISYTIKFACSLF